MELYCAAHPRGPSAARRPQLRMRGQLWIAILGPSIEQGVVGIGPTIEAALRAFDTQYLAVLQPPMQTIQRRPGLRTSTIGAAWIRSVHSVRRTAVDGDVPSRHL